MKSTNTGNLARNVRIVLLCGALLGFLGTSAVAQNPQPNQNPSPNAQPAQPVQPSSNVSPNMAPNSTPAPKPDVDESQPQTQPAQQPAQQPAMTTPDQSKPATSTQPDDKSSDIKSSDTDKKLPKTASDVPLIGALGALAFASALLLHTGRRLLGS